MKAKKDKVVKYAGGGAAAAAAFNGWPFLSINPIPVPLSSIHK